MNLSIITVNFNTSQLIVNMLEILNSITSSPFKFIVVDNGSTPTHLDQLKELSQTNNNVFIHGRKQNPSDSISFSHGSALDEAIKLVDTKYFAVLDSDALFLVKDWDKILMREINDKCKVIGTPPVGYKDKSFPLIFATLFETKSYKNLDISLKPVPGKESVGFDTGWEMKNKFQSAGLSGKCFRAVSTRHTNKTPYEDIICAAYYLNGTLVASHFGRGSSSGKAKYYRNLSLPILGSKLKEKKGKKELDKWIEISSIVARESAQTSGIISYDQLEEVSCPICNGTEYDPFITNAKELYNGINAYFNVVSCNSCKFKFTNPRPKKNYIGKFYPDESGYYQPVISKESKNPLKRAYRNSKKILPRSEKENKVLDIGCSWGGWLNEMKSNGWEVYGLEMNSKCVKVANTQLKLNNVQLFNFENTLPFESNTFDYINLSMVLEHVFNPEHLLREVERVAKKNAVVHISVPNIDGVEFKLYKKHCYGLQVPQHLNHFSKDSIRTLTEKCGLQIRKYSFHNFDRDMVASAKYSPSTSLIFRVLSNSIIRKIFIRNTVRLLSYLQLTSRMSIYLRKAKN